MITILIRVFFVFAVLNLISNLNAAQAPLSKADLEGQSGYIVSGIVLSSSSVVEKSKAERSLGFHRDLVCKIRLRIREVSKGQGLKEGEEIVISAWQASMRIPPVPGPRGHYLIPGKGDEVQVYLLKDNNGVGYNPILPNGFVLLKKNERATLLKDIIFSRQYAKHAVLTKEEEAIIIELARKCGITKVAKISTHNIHPTTFRGIKVESAELVRGREVFFQELNVNYKKWIYPSAKPRKGDFQSGMFWAGNPYQRKQIILKVNGEEYRVRSLDGIEISKGEEIMEWFLAKSYDLGPGVSVNALKQVNWDRPMSFSRHKLSRGSFGDFVSVSFLDKVNDGGFFDLQIKLLDEGILITQLLQAIP